MLDLGASIGADAGHLVDMAAMGSAMAGVLFGLDRPTVGLLNIGVEEVKGLEEVREAGQILRAGQWPQFEYLGFVEGSDIGKGTVDVVVTEGFSGNIALKAAEGTARQLGQLLKHELNRSPIRKLGYLLARGAFRALNREDGSAQVERRRFPRSQRHRHQEPRRHGCGRFRLRRRPRLRHGATRIARQDRPQPHAPPARGGSTARRRGSSLVTMLRSVVLGCGSYLPRRVLPNSELSRMVDTSDEWIIQRTGIRERHIAAEGENTSDMAIAAAREALAAAGVDAQSIDLIVLATSTPDNTFPAAAVSVQAGLGINHGAAFDLQAVCSGFVFGLATADGLLKTGAFKRALVIGAETFSRILDWNDRTTCVLFGDGAGAVVLDAQQSLARARIAASSPRTCARMAATRPSSTSTADRPRPRPSGTCAWKAARSSSTPWR